MCEQDVNAQKIRKSAALTEAKRRRRLQTRECLRHVLLISGASATNANTSAGLGIVSEQQGGVHGQSAPGLRPGPVPGTGLELGLRPGSGPGPGPGPRPGPRPGSGQGASDQTAGS